MTMPSLDASPWSRTAIRFDMQDDAQQRVAEPRSAGEVGGPVARIHVADGDEIAGSGEREHLPEPVLVRDRDGPVDLCEARCYARATPACFGRAPAGERRPR